MKNAQRLFMVVNVDWFFLSHRLPVALAAKKAGYDVTIVTCDTGRGNEIKSHGLNFIDLPFKRSGTNIMYEMKCIRLLKEVYTKHKPDLLHHVTIKVALYGSIAARLSKAGGVVNAISGLGYNFTGDRKGITQRILLFMMKFGFKRKNMHFIFQNEDDINTFKSLNLVEDKQVTLIKGSGVNLQEFAATPLMPDTGKVKVVLPARMLYDKGVIEFIEAAKLLKNQLSDKAEFILAGDVDKENLAAIPEEKIKGLMDGNYLRWIGFQKDMVGLLKTADIVVLPSYREGLPKSLIEAAAIGRPIITTDVPGCRECVVDGYNGFLVPAKDEHRLAGAMLELIKNRELQTRMGQHSRLLAEKEFSIDKVIQETTAIYSALTLN
jgi:glycosyltransferase involved in cell wall biosynthesis